MTAQNTKAPWSSFQGNFDVKSETDLDQLSPLISFVDSQLMA